jgi:hypothetical protein
MTDTHNTESARDDKHRADEQRKADEAHRADAQKKLDEQRKTAHEAEEKGRAAAFEDTEKRREAARKYAEARRKEDERRAALSPPERLAEDQKRAAMTAEDRLKDDEAKGLVAPELQDQINLLAGTPQFPIQTETPHSAEFVLSEASGHGSRDNVTIAIGDSVKVGQTLKITTPATISALAIATGNVTTDVAADAIALYAVPVSTVAQNVAVISRNAEVNGNLLYWPGTITATDKNNIAKALAVHNIMARF